MAKWKLHPHGAPPQTSIYKGFAGIPWNVEAFFQKTRFCVNLGGKFLLHYLTNKLIINTLVNQIELQMCVFFRIFVCEAKKEKAPICMAQRYEEIWTYQSNRPDKINCE